MKRDPKNGSLTILKKRQEFLALNRGRRYVTAGFVLQGRNRHDGAEDIRIGFTCSKKLGNAVARNRAKRRLREIARLGLPQTAKSGWDYALIGRPDATISHRFSDMQQDLTKAMKAIHT